MAGQTVGAKKSFTSTVHPLALIPSIPSIGVDPFHPVDTVDAGNTGERLVPTVAI
ncbi:hypothetical protein [Chloroflexus sp. Y-396-1]|uniref:hypothetical protein n=1 Tax=Chloroflexus sp. Y-396-1 TaxID=867845 RepID=UPI0004BC7FDC|nr:hypothetical protein [Chloroflexus sp. Y-396-1]